MEIKKLGSLIARNIRYYFKDKVLFLVSMITPLILLALFGTFLRTVYIESFHEIFKAFDFTAEDKNIVEGLAGSWLLSSIIPVCSVTVAICSNAVMIQDKIDGAINDFMSSPVKRTTLSLSYFIANFIVTLIVILSVTIIGFIYLAAFGWVIPAADVLLIILDMLLSVLFGTLVAAVVESFISTQGGLSAITSLVSSMYGFMCGAYMPISRFGVAMQNVLCVLPGTYSVGIIRKHFMSAYVDKLGGLGLSEAGQKALMDGFDGNMYVAGNEVPLWVMYVALIGTCVLLLAAYIAIVVVKNKRK